MGIGSETTRRKVRTIGLAVEGVEERVLLSTGIASPLRSHVAHYAAMPKSQKLVLSGNLKGSLTPQPLADLQNVSLTATLQGRTGNRKLGNVLITATGIAPAAIQDQVGRMKLVSQLQVQFVTPSGSDTSPGTLTLGTSRNRSKVPFKVTVSLSNGTDILAGASGTYTIQGTLNANAGSISGRLRGTLRTQPIA
ncbi:hypothetical protein OJF2_52570 [Aquisphaera giovannonii]|uniref:Uncharacterized protein n=1 Tax=Aquisphaera giovannonii TaxID=406548 RepID=A0A5B9W7K8_9BACT|nr:hypothetical protein [Aquisphaera giovannonii]QEH36672.1 hypothetical protein OJF2_52570 [Aquisphaera giovannonii]